MGVISSFLNFDILSRAFIWVACMLPTFDRDEFAEQYGGEIEPPNVLGFALRIFDSKDDLPDNSWDEKIAELINSHHDVLSKRGVCRVSILICRHGQYLMYFTLHEMGDYWNEERAIWHVEPALTFQLELGRLSNYNLTHILVESKQLHIYHAVARKSQVLHPCPCPPRTHPRRDDYHEIPHFRD